MFDTHAHIMDKRFNAAEIIADMPKCGLSGIVAVGFNTVTSRKAASLAKGHNNVYAAVGIHPTEVLADDKANDAALDEIAKLAEHKKVVAYGEIGLDYHWDKPSREIQKKWFCRQIELAVELKLPIIIHSRDCDADMFDIIKSYSGKIKNGLVMHCFSGSAELAQEYVKMGFYISFAGVVTYKNYRKEEVIRIVPNELILTETDCPYLTPEPFRGETNYPSYVRQVVEKLARVRGVSFEEMDKITTSNAARFFNIDKVS